MRQLSISIYFVKAVLRYAVAQGLDPVQLLRQNRISPRLLKEEDARISIERFADLQVSTMLAMGDEGLGYGPQVLPIGSWSMMCHAVINCETLGQALSRYCRFFGLFQPDTAPRFFVQDQLAIVRVRQANLEREPGTDSVHLRQTDTSASIDEYAGELALFNCHRFASWLVQEHLPIQAVNFRHPAPAHAGEYRHMFLGNPVSFAQVHTEMIFNASLLDRPVTQNEQSLARFLRPAYHVSLS